MSTHQIKCSKNRFIITFKTGSRETNFGLAISAIGGFAKFHLLQALKFRNKNINGE